MAALEGMNYAEKVRLQGMLEGLRVLILEDEVLIAMDIEQLCFDHGAVEARIARSLRQVDPQTIGSEIDVAILDLMLGGESTIGFAKLMQAQHVPFVFASGHTDTAAIAAQFPGVVLVGKPYDGNELIRAVAEALAKR